MPDKMLNMQSFGRRGWSAAFSLLCAASLCAADPVLLNTYWDVQVGSPFTIKWNGNDLSFPVIIELYTAKFSDPSTDSLVRMVAFAVENSSFDWTPDDKLPTGQSYRLKITETMSGGSDISPPFNLYASNAAAPSATVSSSSASSPTTSPSSSTQTPATSVSSSSGTTTQSQSSTTTAPPTTSQSDAAGAAGSQPDSNSGSGDLSTGAKAGIGIGVALGVIILILLVAIFFYRRGKAAARAGAGDAQPPKDVEMAKPGADESPVVPISSVASRTLHSADDVSGSHGPVELGAKSFIPELSPVTRSPGAGTGTGTGTPAPPSPMEGPHPPAAELRDVGSHGREVAAPATAAAGSVGHVAGPVQRPSELATGRFMPGPGDPAELTGDVPRNRELESESWAAAEQRILRDLESPR